MNEFSAPGDDVRQYHRVSPLQAQLDSTRANGRCEVEPGEHLGPFVISRPLTLVGHGETTVLWNIDAPVVLITCPGVTLANLWIEVTIEAAHPAIVYLDGCAPVVESLLPPDIRSHLMKPEHIIDLGTLIANSENRLPVEFPPNSPLHRFDSTYPEKSDNTAIGKLKTRNQRNGRGLLLTVTPPGSAGYLVETLTLADERGAHKTEYMVYGSVATKAPAGVSPSMMLMFNDRRSIFFGSALELGDASLALITNNQNRLRKGRFGMIINDSQDYRCLWIPGKPIDGLVYASSSPNESKETLTDRVWVRRLLRNGSTIQCSDIVLKVSDQLKPALNVPYGVEFPAIHTRAASSQTVKVNLKIGFNINWEGQARSLVPWLTVTTPASPAVKVGLLNRTADITVELNDHAFALENGTHFETAALAVYNDDSIYFIGVRLDLNLPDYNFEANPTQLMFPAGATAYAGAIAGQTASVQIANLGRNELTLRLTSALGWINAGPETVKLAPNQSAPVQITLGVGANQVKAGTTVFDDALRITGVESNEVKKIPVTLSLLPPLVADIQITGRPAFPAEFDLGAPLTEVNAVLELTNYGAIDGEFQILASNGVLLASNGGRLVAGEQIQIAVSVPVQNLTQLASGNVFQSQIRLQGGKPDHLEDTATLPISIRVIDRYTQLQIAPETLTIDVIEAMPVDFSAPLSLENTGTESVSGQITSAVAWLSVIGGGLAFQLRPGEKASFTVTATSQIAAFPVGIYPIADVFDIQITGKPLRQPVRFSAEVVVKPAQPDIRPHTHFLWFSEIDQGHSATKTHSDTLVIGNYGSKEWTGKITKVAPWLTVPGDLHEITIPAGQILRLPITVNKLVGQLPIGPVYHKKALILRDDTGEEYIFPARLILAAPSVRVTVQPEQIQFGRISRGSALNAEKRVTVTNNGSIAWHIEAVKKPDWLTVNNMPDSVKPGETVELNLAIAVSASTRERTYNDSLELLGSNKQNLTVEVSFEVVPVRIELVTSNPDNSTHLDLYRDSLSRDMGGAASKLSRNRLILRNLGQAPFTIIRGTKTTPNRNFVVTPGMKFVPSLPEAFTIQPGDELTFAVSVTPDAGAGKFDRAFVLTLPLGDELVISAQYHE